MNNIKATVKDYITIDEPEGFIITGEDNLEVMKLLPDNCIDQIWIDPPYNTGKKWEKNGWEFDDTFESKWHFLHFLGERLIEAERLMNDGASILTIGDYRMTSEVKTYLMDPLFDAKNSAVSLNDVNALMLLKIGKSLHIPESVSEVIITDGPSICLDFFSGSNSYPLACKRLGRRYIGIEKNKTESLWPTDVVFGQDRKDV